MSEKFERYSIPQMIGLSVSFVSYDEDNMKLNICFADGAGIAGISVYNPFTSIDISIDQLVNSKIVATGGDNLSNEFVIQFDCGKLIIDLSPDSYKGPEAFLFQTADGRYFVG